MTPKEWRKNLRTARKEDLPIVESYLDDVDDTFDDDYWEQFENLDALLKDFDLYRDTLKGD